MLRCKMCHMWKNIADQSSVGLPDIQDWKGFIASLRRFIEGEFCINFASGESLMDKNVLELISYASSLGVDTLLNTNAYLVNAQMAKNIAESGLKHIYISLDSLDENTHDFIRGTKGSYNRAMNAVGYLHSFSQNLRIKINTVIMQDNLEGVADLSRWVIRDSRISGINFQAVTQPFNTQPDARWYLQDEYCFLWPKDIKKTEAVLDELIECKKTYEHKLDNPVSQFNAFKRYFRDPHYLIKESGCHMYKYDNMVNAGKNGNIYLCYDLAPIGNIKDEGFDIEKAWYSPTAELIRSQIKACKRNCLWMINCNYEEEAGEVFCE